MRLVKVESFPNREMRVTLYAVPISTIRCEDENDQDGNGDEAVAALTCHSLKTRNGVPGDDDLNSVQQSKPGFGAIGKTASFSNYGRRQMLRAGGAMERHAPHSECLFITTTLPGSTEAAMKAIAEWSGYLVHRLKAWIAKRVDSKLDMYCWEYQKRGALHLHYTVHCPDRNIGEWIRKNVKQEWMKLIDKVCEMSGIDLWKSEKGFSWNADKDVIRVDAQWCEKSVAAYLSKYLGKGSDKPRNPRAKRFPPSRWYGISRPLNALLKSLTRTFVSDVMSHRNSHESYEEIHHILTSASIKSYEYKHKVGTGKTTVSYVPLEDEGLVWMTVQSNLRATLPDSFTNSETRLNAAINQGFCQMRAWTPWEKAFQSLSSKHCLNLASRLNQLESMSIPDRTYLLDTLAYSYRYCRSVRSYVPPHASQWYSRLVSYAAEEEKSPVTGISVMCRMILSASTVDKVPVESAES